MAGQISPMVFCNRNKVFAYPVKQKGFRQTKTKTFQDGHWYIEVNNKNRKTRYDKSLGTGSILRAKQYESQLESTYEFWAKIIKNQEDGRKLKD